MRDRTLCWLAAFGAAGILFAGSSVRAADPANAGDSAKAADSAKADNKAKADYATVLLSIDVKRPASAVWKKIGGFCDIGAVLKAKCVYTSGSGNLGTVRRLADRIDEVMVGQTSRSYTYTQPDSKELYHGTVAVEAAGPNRSKILYSLFYDQSQVKSVLGRYKLRDQRTKFFTQALNTMKKMAEGG
jgi:hypothetical protein